MCKSRKFKFIKERIKNMNIDKINFDEKGLVPAIVQDY